MDQDRNLFLVQLRGDLVNVVSVVADTSGRPLVMLGYGNFGTLCISGQKQALQSIARQIHHGLDRFPDPPDYSATGRGLLTPTSPSTRLPASDERGQGAPPPPTWPR
jgi:hypothetical protein